MAALAGVLLAVLLAGCGSTSTHVRHNADTWEIPLPGSAALQRQIAVVGERLLVLIPLQEAISGTQARAYQLTTGRELWTQDLPPGYDVDAFTVAGDDDLVVAVAGDLIVALDADTGAIRWRVEHHTIWPVQLAADPSGVWMLDGEPRILTRLDRRNGRVRSEVELDYATDVRLLQQPDGVVDLVVLRERDAERGRSLVELAVVQPTRAKGRPRWSMLTTLDALPDPLRSPWLVAPDRDGTRRIVDLRTGEATEPAISAARGGQPAGPLQVEVNAWRGRALNMREIRAWDVRVDSTEPLWRRSVASSRLQLGSAELRGDVLLVDGGGAIVALDAWTGDVLWHRALVVDSTSSGCYTEHIDASTVIAYCGDGDSPSLRSLPDLSN